MVIFDCLFVLVPLSTRTHTHSHIQIALRWQNMAFFTRFNANKSTRCYFSQFYTCRLAATLLSKRFGGARKQPHRPHFKTYITQHQQKYITSKHFRKHFFMNIGEKRRLYFPAVYKTNKVRRRRLTSFFPSLFRPLKCQN